MDRCFSASICVGRRIVHMIVHALNFILPVRPTHVRCPSVSARCPNVSFRCRNVSVRCPNVSVRCPIVSVRCQSVRQMCLSTAQRYPPTRAKGRHLQLEQKVDISCSIRIAFPSTFYPLMPYACRCPSSNSMAMHPTQHCQQMNL
jgi:hypothetical protein